MADFAEESASKVGGGLKKKIGPLEVWQWGAATLGVVFAYLAYKRGRSGGAPSSVPATATSLPPGGANPTDLGTTISGQLTDLTGQVGALQQSVAGLTPPGTSPVAATTTPSGDGIASSLFGLVGRTPSAQDASYWNQYASQNGIYQSIAAVGAGSEAQAYAAANPTAFVQAEYNAIGTTSPDAAGLAYWQGYLQQNGAKQESAAFAAAAKPK